MAPGLWANRNRPRYNPSFAGPAQASAGGSENMLCCLIGLASLSPAGAWIVARYTAGAGETCRHRDTLISAALLAAGVGAACVAGYLLMSASPDPFRPICNVLMPVPHAWPRF